MTISARSSRPRSPRARNTIKRNGIYVLLLAFIAQGVLIDAAIGPNSDGLTTMINNLITVIGGTLLACWWQLEDARGRGKRLRLPSRIMTLVFAPAGIAIYLFQSRPWMPALAHCVVICAGIFSVVVLSSSLGDGLAARGVFPLEMSDRP